MSPEVDRKGRFEQMAGVVYEPLQRYLRRRIPSSDVDDILADVMLTMWRRLDDAPEDVLPWSYGIARRTLSNHFRGRRRHLRLIQRLEAQPHDLVPDHADRGTEPELESALASLSDDDRELLRLWAWEHLEPREIASVLGVSINAATLKLSRARKKLTTQLMRQNQRPAGHRTVEGTKDGQ